MQDAIDNPETGAIWLYCQEVKELLKDAFDVDWIEVFKNSEEMQQKSNEVIEEKNDQISGDEDQ